MTTIFTPCRNISDHEPASFVTDILFPGSTSAEFVLSDDILDWVHCKYTLVHFDLLGRQRTEDDLVNLLW